MASFTPLDDTWHSRDLPVLAAAAAVLNSPDGTWGVRLSELSLDLDPDDVLLACRALEAAELIDIAWVSPASGSRIREISAEARRLVGMWPSPESALDRMVAALEAIAEDHPDPETRSKAKKFGKFLLASGSTIGLNVATAAITGQLPS